MSAEDFRSYPPIPSVDRLKIHFVDEGFRAWLIDLVKVTSVVVGGISREKP